MFKFISKCLKRVIFSIKQITFIFSFIISLIFLFIVFIVKDNLFDNTHCSKKKEIKKRDYDKINNKKESYDSNEEPMFI